MLLMGRSARSLVEIVGEVAQLGPDLLDQVRLPSPAWLPPPSTHTTRQPGKIQPPHAVA